MTILDEIIAYKRHEELPRRKQAVGLATLRAEAAQAPRPGDFVAALRGADGVALIAEIKKASPSQGLLCPDFDPLALAATYVQNGAAAISVLTDEKYFQGRLEHLTGIRDQILEISDLKISGSKSFDETPGGQSLIPNIPTPLLRKDFIVDPYQVYESRAAGADALLLIAAVLSEAELADLLALTRELGMAALVEVHHRQELERVLPLGPRLIGVNNRDLRDFSVDLHTCLGLRPLVPPEVCFVAESGIRSRADVERLAAAGVDAILVGQALVRAGDTAARVRELAGVEVTV
ncbi:MAG: indole-3-glycerol phosphate synthase TrpC [Anaerolineae bacterium]